MPASLDASFQFSYESMGTHWSISVWDELKDDQKKMLQQTIIEESQKFDELYSRFKKNSLVWQLSQKRGEREVPADLVSMLRLYQTMYDLSGGACTPLIGFTIGDLGYDETYSLKPKETVRPVPNFHEALQILDDTHIALSESVLLDVGALGKGFFVDKIASYLQDEGMKRFLVDGSGDIFYKGNGFPLRMGLEHPGDPTKVIGVVEMTDGAMCSSASNRRAWKQYHHTINPHTLTSPEEIIATWVIAQTAAVADGLATCLFLTDSDAYKAEWQYDYCILNKDYHVKRSAGFPAELF